MINMQSTFDLTSFREMNAPKFGIYEICGITIPRGEELFGKTFYAIIGENIYGLKILAWAINGRSHVYLVQTPTFTRWMSLSDIPLFTSVNDLVEGKDRFDIPREWCNETFANAPMDLKITKSEGLGTQWEFNQSFYYSKNDGCVYPSTTKIEYIVGTPQGIFFGLVQFANHYATEDECLSATFNGMDIVDFAEPTVIEIKIEIPSTEVVTRKLVLE